MLSWITEQFTSYKPERAVAVRALRHMRSADRKNLFSDDIMLMRTAEGYWFEYLIYEQLIRIAEQTKTIKKIVRKGSDVKKHKPNASLEQTASIPQTKETFVSEETVRTWQKLICSYSIKMTVLYSAKSSHPHPT